LVHWNGLHGTPNPIHGTAGRAFAKHRPLVVAPTVVANVALVARSIWLMRVGLRWNPALPFVTGIVFFMLFVVMRYADLFAVKGGMLGALALFFLCRASIFGVAKFWTHRVEITNAGVA
jgi:hypothetical protein